MPSKNIELRPEIRIPNLPPLVRYTNPALPKVAKDAQETAPVLEAYEKANEKNRVAIEQAQRHNRRLQKLYNKKAKKKDVETSKWSWPSIFQTN